MRNVQSLLSAFQPLISRSRRSLSSVASASRIFAENLPHIHVSTNPYELEAHGRGESFHPTAIPNAVVSPESTEEIVQVMRLCSEHEIPIIPYGAGTSVEGHVCAIHGGISLDVSKFDSIEVCHSSDGVPDAIAKVGAGVRRTRLNEELRHSGMHFVVDPGADASIGGMVACGASGTTAVKYGTIRENILGLECVLPDGTIAKCGTNALKSSAGYDLTSLMTGSEGTLGVITSVSVKLHPQPEHITAAVCVFDDLFKAAAAVAALKLCDVPMARCELLDETSVSAFNQYNQSRGDATTAQMDEKPTLFLEFHAHGPESMREQVDVSRSVCLEEFGALSFTFTASEKERRALWAARHQLYYASLWLREGSTGALITDVCVPLSAFATIMAQTAEDVKDLGVVGPCFGHAGDGNFHCILAFRDNESEDYLSRCHQVNDNLIRRSLDVGGTCTGEHGVGYGKVKYLHDQYGAGAVHMMKLIKKSIDPKNIMNPGKVLAI